MKVSKRLILRTPTVSGEKCKQLFVVVQEPKEMENTALIVRKLVLTDRLDDYNKSGFDLVREWKGKYVMRQVFSIKLETYNKVSGFIRSCFE